MTLLTVGNSKQKHERRLAAPSHSPGVSKASSNDSMKINIGGDDVKSPTLSSRPVSTSIPSRPGGKEIEEFTKLSLDQGPSLGSGPTPAFGRTPSPSLNPLKRGAVAEAGSPDHAISPGDASRNRRTKTSSGEAFLPKDTDFDRKASTARTPGATQERSANRTLFDPNTDRTFGSGPRRNGHGDTAAAARRAQSSRLHVVPSKKDAIDDRNIDTRPSNRQQPPGIIDKAQLNLGSPVSEDADIQSPVVDEPDHDTHMEEPVPELLFQPETRPISHEQLVTEVKGIYAGLVMVEAKCIDVDEKQSKAAQERDPSKQTRLTAEQWQALIALHKTLLHEHHDFFLASQHPSASPALSKLAAKYSMPARMWRHGIHAFLEVLRHRLPDSLDHMLAFIYIAYSMMALLYETVPAFEDTWIECLGDLGRYRMAIEDDDIRDREVWSGVARFWYGKAADKRPSTGRLFHHLAILARPYTFHQLSLYTRSLTCIIPFESARGSIMTMFNPVLEGRVSNHHRPSLVEIVFIKAHGVLFLAQSLELFVECLQQLKKDIFDEHISRVGAKFKEQGVFAALSNISSLFEYGVVDSQGSSRSIMRLAFDEDRTLRHANADHVDTASSTKASLSIMANTKSPPYQSSLRSLIHASDISFWTLSMALGHIGNRNVFPLVHVYLVFLLSIVNIEKAIKHIGNDVPWQELAKFLTPMAKPETMTPRVKSAKFPQPSTGIGRPLPEDFVMRGQLWSEFYFPETWFTDAAVDDEERALELPSMAAPRLERILWLGYQIAALNRWLTYDHSSKTFGVTKAVQELPLREIREATPLPANRDGDETMADVGDLSQPSACSATGTEKPAKKSSTSEVQPPVSELRPPSASPQKASKVVFKSGKDPPPRQPTKILTREDVDMPDAKSVKRERTPSMPIKAENPDSEEWLRGENQTKAFEPVKIDPDALASDPVKLENIMTIDSLVSTNNKA